MFQIFHSIREQFSPLLKESKLSDGLLTTDEFIQAGDFLCYKFPSWSWSSATIERGSLPKDKQYLVTRHVPCLSRINNQFNINEDELVFEDGFVHTENINFEIQQNISEINEIEEIVEEEVNDIFEDYDPAVLVSDKIIKTRTYDLYITYDFFYQTPRMWIYGYDMCYNPLPYNRILEDISQEHSKKTVTVESFPYEKMLMASIHPCFHGNIMKKLLNYQTELSVDSYLLIFLKFMSTVIPTIEYDYTISIEF